jgi:NAD(P)-dependent dehydrogenase (short-subunit alcohol dehydrogenase family)
MSRVPQLAGQTLVVIGGSSGIGLETARRAREEGADVIITARNPDRLHRVGLELGASIAAFDELPTPIDHVLVTGPGPYYAPLAEFEARGARTLPTVVRAPSFTRSRRSMRFRIDVSFACSSGPFSAASESNRAVPW